MKAIILLTAILLGSTSFAVASDCIRCNSKIACVEDIRAVLISTCGQPDFSEKISSEHKVRYDGRYVRGSGRSKYAYTYNCGEGRLIHVVTLLGGKIVAIESGGRGSGPVRCD